MQLRTIALTFCLGLVSLLVSTTAVAQYKLTNLISNQVGQARHTDPLSVNAWGLVYAPGSPFWVSDEGSGWSTLYNAAGVKQGLEVEIPSANGAGTGSPTGIVWNGTSEFQVQGKSSIFIFATLDGTICAWAPAVDRNNATIVATVKGASYTSLAITNKASGNALFAANIATGNVDMFDGNFNLVNSFTDTTLPPGFTPFGIQDIDGLLYVTFASSAGGSGGFVDVFSEAGVRVGLGPLVNDKHLNQPWGVAIAPKNFGPLSNTLLVSNNTNSGTINAFNLGSGQFVGTIKDEDGKVIRIDQLWGIRFGGGAANDGRTNQLFFTAGPSNNLAGTFGVITAQ
jgi:uncharacterized protein (TIGR03118 family)